MLIEWLQWYEAMGVDEAIGDHPIDHLLPERKNVNPSLPVTTIMPPPTITNPLAPFQAIVDKARALADSCMTLSELGAAVKAFDGCALKRTATNTVFSDGSSNAEIMLMGEAPGANEDAQGIPFCGDSGKLLDVMLSHIGLSREKNLYISNCLFWRPPGNRPPTPEELAICLPFVERHIALIRPKLLILAGATAAVDMLQTKEAVTKLRSRMHEYSNRYLESPIPVAILFHPSYLLRQPSQKKQAWFDLLKIRHYIEEQGIVL